MLRIVRNRLLGLVPLVLGLTMLTFAMMHLTGDDAVDVFYDRAGVAVSEEVKATRRAELGLDKNIAAQYATWLKGVLTLDLGTSYSSGRGVRSELLARLPATIELMTLAVIITIVTAVPLGILAAARRGSMVDRLIRYISFVGNSLPSFFIALLLIYFLALRLAVVAVTSSSIALPALTLAIAMSARYTRQVRAVILEELGRDYVVGARARGIPEWRILFLSVLRVALPTLVTLLALSVGSLLGGTVIVESIFMWDGVGRLAIEAITARDYPVIEVYVVWMALIYVLLNLAADLVNMALDPRLRRGEGRA